MAAPATPPEVMEVKMIPVTATVSKATDNPASALVFIWKPPATMARAPPRVSPVSVIVIAAVPVAAPAVVRTIEVLVAVAAGVSPLRDEPGDDPMPRCSAVSPAARGVEHHLGGAPALLSLHEDHEAPGAGAHPQARERDRGAIDRIGGEHLLGVQL